MSAETILPKRLRAAAPCLGQGSQIEVEQRAAELALSDGREKVDDRDLAQAAAELAGGGTTLKAPKSEFSVNSLNERDELPVQTGHLVNTASSDEDVENIAEQLIGNGLEEADHDIRVTAELERKMQK
ncbi:hypothetical protein [Prosthecobacter sp.]|uniref:hypothetical protein n=1 Tax=Prosthecobacter sp. TaxID=1965333 RepID=UPI0037839BAB